MAGESPGKGKSLGPFLHFGKSLSDLCQSELNAFWWLEGTLLERQQCQGPLSWCHLAGFYENLFTYYTVVGVVSQSRWSKGKGMSLTHSSFFLRENRIYWGFKIFIYFSISSCKGGAYLSKASSFPCKRRKLELQFSCRGECLGVSVLWKSWTAA